MTRIHRILLLLAAVVSVTLASQGSRADAADAAAIRAVPFRQVTVSDPFWSPRLATNRAVTAAHVLDECERTGRLANFRIAAKAMQEKAPQPGGMRGLYFNDSDVYKAIEGCANLLATERDQALEARCDAIIELIAAAQEPDGYIYTPRTILDASNMPPGGRERWSDMGAGHELYCVGHLYEAAVAYAAATGKRRLLEVALRNLDLVAKTFGPKGMPHPCGHPEIELALARLHEATGDARALELLRFFIETRGKSDRGRPLYGEYAQDHAPVLDQREAVGHAVRLAYLQSGVVDLARLTGDARYLDASRRVWEDIISRKMYLTGGIGSQGNNEGFGLPFELANGSAYNETCASIAFVQWSHRLFLATGDARYIDVLERTLHNGVLAGWSISGNRFFYPNPLESTTGRQRVPWFDCACCPPNVLRFIASVPEFAYATAKRDLFVNLFIGGTATTEVAGVPLRIDQSGAMPLDGRVRLSLAPERESAFALRIRVPAWAAGRIADSDLYRAQPVGGAAGEPITLTLNGAPIAARVERGYAVIDRTWRTGDVVDITLDMPLLSVEADERVAANRGRRAFVRGPFVYCLEAVDHDGRTPLGATIDPSTPWAVGPAKSELGDAPTLRGRLRPVERAVDGGVSVGEPFDARAIPYALWANREQGAMAVWLASDPTAAKPAPAQTLARRAKATSSFGGDVGSLSDQLEPASSGDHEHPFLHWWPRMGTEETVTYEFAEPTTVRAVEVYWFDDTGRGACRLPESWRLEAKRDGVWAPVTAPSGFGIEPDRYNRCSFEPIRAEGLRLIIQSRKDFAGGVHEWRVESADAPAAPAIQSSRGLENGAFEERADSAPRGWSKAVWGAPGGDADMRFVADAPGRSGNAVGIASEQGVDAAWSQTVPIEPWSRYRMSGWIRTENLTPLGGAAGALINIHGDLARTPAVKGTQRGRKSRSSSTAPNMTRSNSIVSSADGGSRPAAHGSTMCVSNC
jgi:uncharacterized protein